VGEDQLTIRDFFEDAVRERPDKVFLRAHDGQSWQTQTYREVHRAVIRHLAAFLKTGMTGDLQNGFRERLAIMRENCPEWIISYLAAACAGFIVVPVDPKLMTCEAEHILCDSGAKVVLAENRLRQVLDAANCSADRVYVDAFDETLRALTQEDIAVAERFWDEHRPDNDDLASIVYTSGTTGAPKGAMLSHANFTSNVEQTFKRVMFYESDHFLLVLPLFHVFAFTVDFLVPLRKMAEISFVRSMRSVVPDMMELHPTVLMAVPLLAELIYGRAKSVICLLRVLGLGGAPISMATLEGLAAAGVFVLEGYGITECSPGVAYPDEHRYVPGTVGTPLDGMEWRITDSDETGAGELRVKGPNVSRGYWNNPAETAKAFDADGFYRTGDIVRPALNGNFTICGRTKALIVNREGKNIYPEEIERTIARCVFVKDVIVVGYRMGDEIGEHVGAIVVQNIDAVAAANGGRAPANDETAARVRAEVREICHKCLTEYKLPRKVDVRFVPLERTPSMKVKRFIYARALDE